jgi:hypothetical protein
LIEDIYEPLLLFHNTLKEKHARNVAEFFETLVKKSGVKETPNSELVKKIKALEQVLARVQARQLKWKIIRAFVLTLIIGSLIASGTALYLHFNDSPIPQLVLIVSSGAACSVLGIIFLLKKAAPVIKNIQADLAELNQLLAAEMNEAWKQMRPLNDLYAWNMATALVSQTVPRIEFDPFFNRARLQDLKTVFGWDDSFNENKSVLFAQSGAINGNPFVVAETLNFAMGTKIYSGAKTIHWSEWTTDHTGKRMRVTRQETLRATVEKPAPMYSREKFLIYGNEAAPHLIFSRTPSALSNKGDGFFAKMQLKNKIKKLEQFSRNLTDASQFVIMSNREFDALFNATDRNDEIEYRLLFTPLAQQNMVNLLKDTKIGYGDDFIFKKHKMSNIIFPQHLTGIDLSCQPAIFQTYDLATARKIFNEYHNNYFKALYFALAPLLTIPLYQQHRPHKDIYQDVYRGENPAFWEYESLANYYGERKFAHEDSSTKNILKTEALATAEKSENVAVTAYGFKGSERVDYVSVFGGDGHLHNVPVHWIKYTPVAKTSQIVVHNVTNETAFNSPAAQSSTALLRRNLLSFISEE